VVVAGLSVPALLRYDTGTATKNSDKPAEDAAERSNPAGA
jgi:hypothetical protein